MPNLKNTNIRFNLDKPLFKSAWDYMQSVDKSEFPSHSILIAKAVNEFFERRTKIKAEPFLESREREEKFTGDIIGTVKTELEKYIPVYLAGLSGRSIVLSTENSTEIANDEVDNSDLIDMDFAG